ncbi:hypothetical protein VCUG_00019 [Vavraia culicis subsp. floridensis]|uniref:Uncharacterized protein n=1 Tax=Vavraia culicis (isolate floridensis) TaxID=948595 RepID=L2GZB7_VAVCU|nr:uncharacterized protein VCUG_00019 [Vavraia culicis subsp. floridensis]ELA48410.1 hypothetical protein VCUG_00019 [Vavraia culicis subsp. floridensis]
MMTRNKYHTTNRQQSMIDLLRFLLQSKDLMALLHKLIEERVSRVSEEFTFHILPQTYICVWKFLIAGIFYLFLVSLPNNINIFTLPESASSERLFPTNNHEIINLEWNIFISDVKMPQQPETPENHIVWCHAMARNRSNMNTTTLYLPSMS